MDLKTVELEILKINEDFITYLDKVIQESDDKAESMLRDLNLKVDEKSTFLKSLEANLIEEDEKFKSKLNEFILELDNLTKSTKAYKYGLQEVLEELQKQKNEELKPFLLHQKKKKTEFTHKITAQRKELTFLHKDNNTKLLEEEKNYKNREIELTRRMGIDLDRLNEANVKQYSDIERSILELEDEKLIKESQKKINSIRLIGIKESLNIKNKYALQNYENALDFKKYQEKVILDNSVLTEEFKQRVKSLENEKEQLEDEEALRIAMKDFDNELKLREFTRENEIDQCEFEKEKAESKNNINDEFLVVKTEQNKTSFEYVAKINSEIYSFDKVQMTQFNMVDNYLIASDKKIIESLVASLRNYILSFKELLVISVEEYCNNRIVIFDNLISLLSSSKFGLIYSSNSNYENFQASFAPIIEEYVKSINSSFVKFTNIIKTMIKSLENQLNLGMTSLRSHWQENENLHSNFFNRVARFFDDEFSDKEHKLIGLYNTNNLNATNSNLKSKEEYKKQKLVLKEKTKSIINDYNIQKKDILSKIENYKYNLKIKQDSDRKDLNRFIKQSKYKINHYKSVYNENILNHERIEHNRYKEATKQNKIEYKNRLESIGK